MRPRYSAGILHAHRASSAPSCSPRCLNGNFEPQRQRQPLTRPFLGRQNGRLHSKEIFQGMYHLFFLLKLLEQRRMLEGSHPL